MNWKIKAIVHWFFSKSRIGLKAHYWFQTNITKSLPTKIDKYQAIIDIARTHVDYYTKYSSHNVAQSIFFEFGAGWDLLIPLTFYSLGVEKQIIVDILPLAKLELANDTIAKLQKIPIEWVYRKPTKPLTNSFLIDLAQNYGIEYRAPCDARQTNLMPGTVHCITSTNTLEHIPEDTIKQILHECHRILSDRGIVSMKIDYQDHYSYFDTNITAYNFLKYSDEQWKLFNPETHYQNRLRHCDFLNLFDKAGFELIEEHRVDGSTSDVEFICQLPVDVRFKNYSNNELAVRSSSLVFRKKM